MTRPRLLFMAMLPPTVLELMQAAVAQNGLDALLGSAMFPAQNWHQSLSDRYWEEAGIRERMLRAGARVSARAFTLTLNRIRDQALDGSIHWAFRAKGNPEGFAALVTAAWTALSEEGLDSGQGHTPHVTLSYSAPDRIPHTEMTPIDWTIDTLMLVVGGGRPYHYAPVACWPLQPPASASTGQQLRLF
jgi:2'-5' RNA ligase